MRITGLYKTYCRLFLGTEILSPVCANANFGISESGIGAIDCICFCEFLDILTFKNSVFFDWSCCLEWKFGAL